MRASLPGRFIGATHEYFAAPSGAVERSLTSLSIDDRHDGGHRAHKFDRDRRLLERELAREPANTRALFYLAETYRGLGNLPKALALYRRRSEAGGWEEEAWYAQYVAGQLVHEAGAPRQAFRVLAGALRRDPGRHETYVHLASLLRARGHHQWACRLARAGLRVGVPTDRRLFVDRGLHDWGLPRELSISAFHVGARRDGLEANERLALGRGAPADATWLALENGIFYAEPLPGASYVPVTPALPPEFAPCNPSIVRTTNGYVLNCRAVSYRIEPDGHYVALEADGIFRSRNILMRLDRDLAPLGESPVETPTAPVRWHPVQGLEDVRLFTRGDRLGFLCTTTNLHPAGPVRISLGGLTSSGQVDHHRPVSGHGDDRPQKNWLPFVAGFELFALYGYEPLVVLKIDDESGDAEVVAEQPQGRDFHHWRGSAGPIALPARVGGGRLVLVHAVATRNGRRYTHRLLRVDDEWHVTHASRPFYFRRLGIEFACGMCLAHGDDEVLITFGVEDREAWVCRVSLEEVCRQLVALPDWPPARTPRSPNRAADGRHPEGASAASPRAAVRPAPAATAAAATRPRACLVTGYVRLDAAHRGNDRYSDLGGRLLGTGLPMVACLDPAAGVEAPATTTVLPATLEDCWYRRVVGGLPLPAAANPAKDTLDFLAVTHQKARWMADAAAHTDAEVLAWVDFGIVHVPGVTPDVIRLFFDRLSRARLDVVTAPSIWGLPRPGQVDFDRPAWFFAGGVLIVPRGLAHRFATSVEETAMAIAGRTRTATWEVNTWSALAATAPELFTSYRCDHDVSLFEHFRP